jgi:hypothetical protein
LSKGTVVSTVGGFGLGDPRGFGKVEAVDLLGVE